MGTPQQAEPLVIGLAGNKGSGKTTIAEALALRINATILSFGAYVRTKAAGTLDAVQLADLGARLLDAQGPRAFIDDAISTLAWDGHSPLIIEGIRHTRILDALLARFPHMKLAYVTAPNAIRDDRLKARDDLDLAAITALGRHSTETEVSALEARASWAVDGTDAQNAALVIAREVAP